MHILNSILFNPFANALAERAEKMWPLNSRSKAMFSDFARGMGILSPLIFPVAFLMFYFPTENYDFYLFWPFLILVMFNKDIIGGRSIAKRQFGFAIVKYRSGEPASQLQCFIRNITCIIWPLEALITLTASQQRIGDFISGTKVIEQPPEDNLSFTAELLNTKITFQLILGNILVIVAGVYAKILI